MYSATVEILITKGRFEPAVAMAEAEALDMTLQNAQLVTVPILDNRFAVTNACIDARLAAAETKTSSRFAAVEVRLAQLDGQIKLLDERMKRFELRLIIWVAAIVFGNSHLGEAIAFIASFLRTLPN